MNQLEDLLQQCTVKLTVSGQIGTGTGFFVAPGLILTCAHVVDSAGKSPIQIMWNNQENWAQAVVIKSFPKPYDLALLKVDLPIDANPPCVYLSSEVQSRDPLYLFGYPDIDFPNGCPVTFECEGLTGDDPAQIKFALGQVRPGMSGSPLLNQRTGAVCGIVQSTRDRSFDLGGGAIQTSVILAKFPELLEQQQSFHQQDQRWHNLGRGSIKQSTPQIDWLTESKTLLEEHKQRLSSNPLQGLQPKNFDVYVPLGLVKREKKERPQVDRNLDPSPERGSDFYRVETTPIEHDEFLKAVSDRQPGEHIVILGEPGAGKTTLLTRVWESLLVQNSETPMIVAWIPLAGLGDRSLEEYVEESWLAQVCEKDDKPAYLASLKSARQAGKLYLLLDGADEIGGNGLKKIEEYLLRSKWAKPIKSVVTCRLNLWDGSERNELNQNFKIFRTLDFQYASPAGDEVDAFILKWFGDDPAAGKKLRLALDEPGKERIKDLAQNPLRLTLLCNIWLREQGLPDTQAGLYERFVNYTYRWSKVTDAVELQSALDRVMGQLAKYGINKPSLRFRFTEEELQTRVLDLEHRKALKDLGWLNCVGEDESGKAVYAFFHPTFQEYFAACAIDDWDYFLPRAHIDRPVPCRDEQDQTYRVFEQEWRQVILLWVGRSKNELSDELKEEFINNLTNFKEQIGQFYYYRAYCMAAIFSQEMKSSLHINIAEKIVEWAFGYFNTRKNKWENFSYYIENLAKETIPFIDRSYAITAIVKLFRNLDLDDDVTEVLEQIVEVGDREVIMALIERLEQPHPQFGFHFLSSVGNLLGRIGVGNKEAIMALVQLLGHPDVDNWFRSYIVNTLYQSGVRTIEEIDSLLQELDRSDLNDEIQFNVRDMLWRISIDLGTEEILSSIQLLGYPGLDAWLRNDITKTMMRIDIGNKEAIAALITLLGQSNTSDVIEILVQIGIGDAGTIETLSQLLKQPDLDDRLYCDVAAVLGLIDQGNPAAIDKLIQLLNQTELDDQLFRDVARALGQVGGGNPAAIKILLQLLKHPNLNDLHRYSVFIALGNIGVGNSEVITAMIKLLGHQNKIEASNVVRALRRILTKSTMPFAIYQLKKDFFLQFANFRFKKIRYYLSIVQHCTTIISYSDFYATFNRKDITTSMFLPGLIYVVVNEIYSLYKILISNIYKI